MFSGRMRICSAGETFDDDGELVAAETGDGITGADSVAESVGSYA